MPLFIPLIFLIVKEESDSKHVYLICPALLKVLMFLLNFTYVWIHRKSQTIALQFNDVGDNNKKSYCCEYYCCEYYYVPRAILGTLH